MPGGGVLEAGAAPPAGAAHHQAPVFSSASAVSASEWRGLLDQLPYGFIVLGPGQELRHENATCRQLLGYGVAEKGGVEGWLAAVCPDRDHRDKVINSWREHIWRNQLTRTFTLRTAAQKLKEIEFRSSLLRDGGITLTIEDVTEARRIEETLRHGKLKFRALFSHSETGTVLVDRTGRIIDANPAFLSLAGISLKQLRLSSLAELLHPHEAAELAGAADSLARPSSDGSAAKVVTREVWLRTRSAEKRARVTYCPVGEDVARPAMAIYLFTPLDAIAAQERLAARLRVVSAKAQALLHAVPDLILLIDPDGSIVDFVPPPQPWAELVPEDSWRGRAAGAVWPVFGDLLQQCQEKIADGGKTIHADIRGSGEDGSEFGVTLAPCGDGQVFAVIRQRAVVRVPVLCERERDPTEGATRSSTPVATDAATPGERRQHSFRNQLQLVTSLFSLEPQGAAARDAFLRWQIRLRSMAQACPHDEAETVWVFPLLRNIADEICSLTGRGPGRRSILITGSEDITLDVQTATPFSLLLGELMRLVLAPRRQGPGPELLIHLEPHAGGGFQLAVRPGTYREFVFTDRDTEVEILELLTEQIQGRLEATDPENPAREWVLIVPSRNR